MGRVAGMAPRGGGGGNVVRGNARGRWGSEELVGVGTRGKTGKKGKRARD